MAKRKVDIAICNICERSILPDEGGVQVFTVSVTIDDETRTGDLCEDDLGPLRAWAEVLDPAVPRRRRRRSFEDSIVTDPSQIPALDESSP